jgi:DNA-directed RNA polymerase subunit RPC12/RpoP
MIKAVMRVEAEDGAVDCLNTVAETSSTAGSLGMPLVYFPRLGPAPASLPGLFRAPRRNISVIGLKYDREVAEPDETRFNCANCGAEYEVVRVEAPLTAKEREIVCVKCGGPLNGRDGGFVLKYFLAERVGSRNRRKR